MVAIAVFSIVMVAATGALLNVIDANNKAKSIKTAVNNITLALETISKDMRMGSDYFCDDGDNDGDCHDGGTLISFKSSKTERPYIYYKFEDKEGIGQIFSCVSEEDNKDGNDCSGTYFALTSSEVDLKSVRFYVTGVDNSTNAIGAGKTQPRVIITISGEAGSKIKTKTQFDLQTSISQVSRPVKK